jgi:hypothetical protein
MVVNRRGVNALTDGNAERRLNEQRDLSKTTTRAPGVDERIVLTYLPLMGSSRRATCGPRGIQTMLKTMRRCGEVSIGEQDDIIEDSGRCSGAEPVMAEDEND